MKIAFLHHSFIIGSGIDSLIYQYAKRMSVKHEVEIFTFRSYYKLPTDSWKINVIDIPFGHTRLGSGVFAPLFMPWHYLRNRLSKFDVVVTQLYPANLIPVLPTKIDTKVIEIEWSTPQNVWARWQENLYTKLADKASKIACNKADKVLVGSEFAQRYVKKHYGVDSTKLWLDGLDFELLNKGIFKSNVNHNILYVGRVSPHKNLDMLIKALGWVKHEISDATLTIVGSHTFPEYTIKLRELAIELELSNSITWAGAVPWDKLPQYYADCSVYCSPSLWEGFMRCESFAFEKPMVVFDATANSETAHNGIDGVVVKHISPRALAEPLMDLLKNDDKRIKMGKAGYRWARKNMNLDIITKELLNELSS